MLQYALNIYIHHPVRLCAYKRGIMLAWGFQRRAFSLTFDLIWDKHQYKVNVPCSYLSFYFLHFSLIAFALCLIPDRLQPNNVC